MAKKIAAEFAIRLSWGCDGNGGCIDNGCIDNKPLVRVQDKSGTKGNSHRCLHQTTSRTNSKKTSCLLSLLVWSSSISKSQVQASEMDLKMMSAVDYNKLVADCVKLDTQILAKRRRLEEANVSTSSSIREKSSAPAVPLPVTHGAQTRGTAQGSPGDIQGHVPAGVRGCRGHARQEPGHHSYESTRALKRRDRCVCVFGANRLFAHDC